VFFAEHWDAIGTAKGWSTSFTRSIDSGGRFWGILTQRKAATAGSGGQSMLDVRRREFITLLGGVVSLFLCVSATAQEGYYGVGHDKWHQGFYSKLKRNDGGGSCCNLMDCRPTQSRIVGDHYEVKVDGAWTPVPYDKINNVIAPDGGAHVCAPPQRGPV
jgi:hypothetical protein